jgi:hypothetical protein
MTPAPTPSKANAALRPVTRSAASNGVMAAARVRARAARDRISTALGTVGMEVAPLRHPPQLLEERHRCRSTTMATPWTDCAALLMTTKSATSPGDFAARVRASAAWELDSAEQVACRDMETTQSPWLPQRQSLAT